MENSELISRFLEETGYCYDDKTLLILAYGSRITHTNKDNSDLDVLIVSADSKNYKRAMLVDGIPIDITIVSLDYLERDIYNSLITNSAYYRSIIKNGVVVMDRMNTFESMQYMLERKVKKKKWYLDLNLIEEVEYHIRVFMNTGENHHYFKALELLRRLHHINYHCSNIRFTKVYDLYTDKEKAKNQYLLKLPNDDYIDRYLKALEERDTVKRLEYLREFYHEFDNSKFKEFEEKYYPSEDEIKKKLYYLNNAICRCEDMLLANHPYAKALYYILIDDIYSLMDIIHHGSIERIDYESEDIDVLINNLENLFAILNRGYSIDYDDIILKL